MDFIVEIKNEDGSESHVGFDLAVSKSEEYLEGKDSKPYTVCREFNRYKGWGKAPDGYERSMERQVFSISPKAMAAFLTDFMKGVAS